jgi:hypothetical protein
MTTPTAIARVLGFAVLCPVLSLALAGASEQTPKKSDLVETAGAHLGQIEVLVTGPREAASRLTESDFKVKVGGQAITSFRLDAMCAAEGASAVPRSASIVFYFDQRHLTTTGRRRAIEVVREMVPRLVVDGNRAMVVSSAGTLKIVTPFTSRGEGILAALAKLENDPEQVDVSAYTEELQVERLGREIDKERADREAGDGLRKNKCCKRVDSDLYDAFDGSVPRSLARQYEREEAVDARQDLLRIVGILRRIGGVDAPKVFLYFADTMRRNAGEHYQKLVSSKKAGREAFAVTRGRGATVGEIYNWQMRVSDTEPRWSGESVNWSGSADGKSRVLGSEGAYAEVLAEAAAQNVRFYPVQADGLVAASERERDAQDTLSSFAAETGGRAFLGATPADQMAKDLLGDLSCAYLISFDPAGFSEDQVLPVRVRVKGRGLAAHANAQMVILSESARKVSRLLSAITESRMPDAGTLAAAVIPTGYEDGKFSGLVQIAVSSTAGPPGDWEIGGVIVEGNAARDLPSRTVGTNAAGVPIVFESEERFTTGRQEVVAVAREVSTNKVASQVVDVTWPEIGDRPAILPTVVLQPVSGAFARGDAARTRGSLARIESEPLRPEVATTLVSLVCWPEEQRGSLHVERKLRGDAETLLSFPTVDLETASDRCAQVRDTIPAKVMGSGVFHYQVVVQRDKEEPTRAERSFVVQAALK